MPKLQSPTVDELRDLIASAGWTQVEAAELVGSTRRTLQDWLAGIAPMHPGLWELMRLKGRQALRKRP
jgi:transcriptional regulator with XRE-family HTH domain